MTGWRKRTIIEMAREAQLPYFYQTGDVANLKQLEAFAALVREEERERIAKWYASEGHMMFPVAIPKAIRSGK